MRFLKFASFILIGSILISCGGTPKGTNVSGVISDAAGLSIYFDRLGPDNTSEILMNTKSNSSGAFKFKFPEGGLKTGIYRIRAGAKSADLILTGTEKSIEINGDLKSFGELTYNVTGAPLTTIL